jgi:hypothetical protein
MSLNVDCLCDLPVIYTILKNLGFGCSVLEIIVLVQKPVVHRFDMRCRFFFFLLYYLISDVGSNL